MSFTDKNWPTSGEGTNGSGKRDGRDGRIGSSAEDVVEAVDVFNSFVVCRGFALGGLTVVCFEYDEGMLVAAGFTEAKSSEAAEVIGDVIERVKFEGF